MAGDRAEVSVGDAVVRFVHELGAADLPAGVLERARWCLLDLVGVAWSIR